MNEMNPLEAQLQSWTLRRPSDRIKRALFISPKPAAPAPVQASRRRSGGFVPGLLPLAGPAFACFIALMAVNGPEGLRSSNGRSVPLFASISSNVVDNSLNADDFFFVKTDSNLDRNNWMKATFEWTNWWVSSSSNGSLPLAKTNWFR